MLLSLEALEAVLHIWYMNVGGLTCTSFVGIYVAPNWVSQSSIVKLNMLQLYNLAKSTN